MFENTSKRISEVFKKLSGNSKITERNVEEAVEEIKNTNEFIPNIEWFQCNYICGVCDECMYKDMG